jgi:ABC-type multidrug transport system ATPase subunit/pSer/pThr/pTyr-binding forkhead associated (FHA) protein
MPPLHISVPGAPDLRFGGDRTVVVGRDPGCDVVADDPLVSREHCVLEPRADGWLLTDRGSRNGTFAGAERVRAILVRPGEQHVLRLGSATDGVTVTVRVEGGTLHPIGHGGLAIGRVADNDVVVDDLLVSRYHATVQPLGDGRLLVTDLGGRNGTFVNGHRVGRAAIAPGDRLTVGRRTFGYDGAHLVEGGPAAPSALVAEHLSVSYGTVPVLSDVSFSVPSGTFMAIIGPSGAGKSTLLRALTGSRGADRGRVLVDGIDLYPSYDEVRHRIGLVPQDDVLHDQLKVGQALRYAAALRLPDDTPAAARDARVDSVLAQLDLTARRDLPIHRLSGGQRKRASVAMELLTEPSLLYLDEPTSGLDPLLDREVMRGLRSLADRGRTVVVVTHSTLYLNLCDTILVLARGGRVAYCGPPDGLLAHFGAADYADVFTELSDDATSWASRWTPPAHPVVPASPASVPLPPRQSRRRQLGLLLHRAGALAVADRRQLALLLGLPLVLAGVVQTVPGTTELALVAGQPPPRGAGQLLVILVIGAAFTGMAGTVRELVAERPIYLREWAVGLRPGTYLGAKLVVSALVCAVQAVLLATLALIGRTLPEHGVLTSARAEIVAVLALTAFAASAAGLLASALVTRTEHTMPILVVAVMAQLVLSGGLFGIADRAALAAVAVLSPTRWGYAATAATVDLRALSPGGPADDLWRPEPGVWALSISLLAVLAAVYATAAFVVLRLREQRPRR